MFPFYCFKLSHISGRPIWFAAVSERERIEWIVALQHAILNTRIEKEEKAGRGLAGLYPSVPASFSSSPSYQAADDSAQELVSQEQQDIAKMKRNVEAFANSLGRAHPAIMAIDGLSVIYENACKDIIQLRKKEAKYKKEFEFKTQFIYGKSYTIKDKDLNALFVASGHDLMEQERYMLIHLLREKTSKEMQILQTKKECVMRAYQYLREHPDTMRSKDVKTYPAKFMANVNDTIRKKNLKAELEVCYFSFNYILLTHTGLYNQ